eukprot:CAMPEP_0168523884 /NCGR_PEP_ID=MMETSP0405-20121227/10277_1 /TAXON_ID=498012 /ORGANISM="Trichosphaerium sp, Strain Am-I-7 wt" /LENGTH=36 /DNA_ID= /DNA_START= /DNA_END= /DNA_ORIENTATION=
MAFMVPPCPDAELSAFGANYVFKTANPDGKVVMVYL